MVFYMGFLTVQSVGGCEIVNSFAVVFFLDVLVEVYLKMQNQCLVLRGKAACGRLVLLS